MTRLALSLALFLTLGAGATAAAVTPPYVPPRIESRTLANGLTVHVLPAPGIGLVHIQVRIPAGVAAEPAGLEGVSSLAASMLTSGTTLRDAQRIDADLIRLGTTVEAMTGPEFATVSGTFLSRDAAEGAGLISDLVLHPLFPDEEMRRVQRLAVARAMQTPPAAAAQEEALAAALPGVAGARPLFGNAEAVRRMRREDLRAFHREHYVPAGAAVAFSGDLTADQAFALAEEWFGSWNGKAGTAPRIAVPAERPPVRILDRPELAVAEVRVVYPVPGRSASDRAAREFAAELFARERNAARSRWSSTLHLLGERGAWVLSASVPADSVAAEVTRVRDALADFVSKPRPAASVQAGARLVRALFPMGLETVSQRATRWLLADFSGETPEAFTTLPARIAKLTPADVQAAAARELDVHHPVVVAAGPAAKLRPQLASLGDVAVVEQRNEDARAVETAAPEDVRRARTLIEQSMAALGGEAKLREVHDTVVESELTLTVRGETIRGRLRQIRKDPDQMKMVTTLGTRQTFQVLSGRQSWSLLPGDTTLRVGDSTEVANLRATFRTDPVRLLRAAADSTSRVAYRGRESLGDREGERVDVVFEGGGARRLFFDPISRRLLAVEALDPARPMVAPTRWLFADYRQVQGIWWPHEERRLVGGEPYMQLRTVSVQFNSAVRDEEFQAPARAPRRAGR